MQKYRLIWKSVTQQNKRARVVISGETFYFYRNIFFAGKDTCREGSCGSDRRAICQRQASGEKKCSCSGSLLRYVESQEICCGEWVMLCSAVILDFYFLFCISNTTSLVSLPDAILCNITLSFVTLFFHRKKWMLKSSFQRIFSQIQMRYQSLIKVIMICSLQGSRTKVHVNVHVSKVVISNHCKVHNNSFVK